MCGSISSKNTVKMCYRYYKQGSAVVQCSGPEAPSNFNAQM